MRVGAVISVSEDGVLFWCPGCQMYHGVWTKEQNGLTGAIGPKWSWNGSREKPTFAPSILVRGTVHITPDERRRIMAGEKVQPKQFVCHSYVTDGRIQFLNDCTHALAGQTVDLVPEPEAL